MKPVIIVAFDIETRGISAKRHGILAVGVVAGFSDGSILFKRTWKVSPLSDEQTFEPRCLEEFWSKNQDILRELQTNPISSYEFAHHFRNLLNELEKDYTIYLASDNPTFDAGWINYYLDAFNLDSMQHGVDGKSHRFVHDTKSYARGSLGTPFETQRLSNADVAKELNVTLPVIMNEGRRAHMPADDAEMIFLMHCAVVNKK